MTRKAETQKYLNRAKRNVRGEVWEATPAH